MVSSGRNKLALFAFFASCFAFGVIALGALTRLMDAGLGCPDWPGCYGHWIVPLQHADPHWVAYKAWAEMVHRYFVAGLSVLVTIIVTMIFLQKKYRTRINVICASGLVLLLLYQIMLGRWTVTLKLLPIIVTQHLLGGFFILAILWLIYLCNQNKNIVINTKQNKQCLPWAIIAAVLLLLQISLGAWTSTNYASLSCIDFPFCNNQQPFAPLYLQQAFDIFTPLGVNYEGGVLPQAVRQTIQMMHRLGALVLSLYLFIFVAVVTRKLRAQPHILRICHRLLGLLLLQLCLGMTNVMLKLPLIAAIGHNLVAVLLLLTVIMLIVACLPNNRERLP